mmetsp:Transcript_63393/g.185339  ORF Transcript_63393/g.185339 Transcript_63393/m.185339 type:complete len:213 (-) Transcript_63393:56-694(-)
MPPAPLGAAQPELPLRYRLRLRQGLRQLRGLLQVHARRGVRGVPLRNELEAAAAGVAAALLLNWKLRVPLPVHDGAPGPAGLGVHRGLVRDAVDARAVDARIPLEERVGLLVLFLALVRERPIVVLEVQGRPPQEVSVVPPPGDSRIAGVPGHLGSEDAVEAVVEMLPVQFQEPLRLLADILAQVVQLVLKDRHGEERQALVAAGRVLPVQH